MAAASAQLEWGIRSLFVPFRRLFLLPMHTLRFGVAFVHFIKACMALGKEASLTVVDCRKTCLHSRPLRL